MTIGISGRMLVFDEDEWATVGCCSPLNGFSMLPAIVFISFIENKFVAAFSGFECCCACGVCIDCNCFTDIEPFFDWLDFVDEFVLIDVGAVPMVKPAGNVDRPFECLFFDLCMVVVVVVVGG